MKWFLYYIIYDRILCQEFHSVRLSKTFFNLKSGEWSLNVNDESKSGAKISKSYKK